MYVELSPWELAYAWPLEPTPTVLPFPTREGEDRWTGIGNMIDHHRTGLQNLPLSFTCTTLETWKRATKDLYLPSPLTKDK